MKSALLLIILFSSFAYAEFQGDGTYSKETDENVFLWFDFHNHEIIFPTFPINRIGNYSWQFEGYCSNNGSFSVDFITVSTEMQTWWQDETNLEVEVVNNQGQSLFKKSGALNSYQATYKIRDCKVITRQDCPPLENEWTTSYYFMSDHGGKLHEGRSIVLSNKNKETTVKKEEHHYYNVVHDAEIGCGKYVVTAKVNKPFWGHTVNGKIRIVSGWK
ncbi:hypothetical protein [Gilvimarinus polysaccharolyticus]|uniref:hypothetical protein n=1 Tax=Gilvimarinus polysaccharolyticus TaxID=863921 RepID=UPI000673A0D0|nr:hypothetical protein [Gilvimarinus polysaccharolyticus]